MNIISNWGYSGCGVYSSMPPLSMLSVVVKVTTSGSVLLDSIIVLCTPPPQFVISSYCFRKCIISSPDPKGSCELLSPLSVRRLSSVVRPLTFHILINPSEAAGPIWTKLWWNGPWMAPFQNCVWWSRLPTKMAAKLKIEKRGGWNFNCWLLL